VVTDGSFTPSSTTVTAGTTVTWTWSNTFDLHNVTFSSGTNSPNQQANGSTFARAFPTAGTFPYSCTNHPAMTGTIIVQ
jgi:plastocyanin